MKNRLIFILITAIALMSLIIGTGVGSVYISAGDILKIIINNIFGISFDNMPADNIADIIMKVRMPRVCLAFIVGALLSISGVIMQSLLQNPLASSYTLGISSGAAVGASIAIILGLSFFGIFTLSFFGLSFGLATVILVVALSSKLDKNLSNNTIILVGMAISLFANSIISLLMTFAQDSSNQIVFWQMGSFSGKGWSYVILLLPVIIVGLIISLWFSTEMDIMTFGKEQAMTSGVNTTRLKWILLSLGSLLTGCAVAVSGIIGFVDLFVPHVARRIFGSKHRLTIPASAILGGTFMVLSDLIARTIFSPIELPIGAITSAVGAPFFIYLYFSRRKGGKNG